MRKLMWFAIGFTAACTAGVYLVNGFWLLLLAAFCLVGMVAAFLLKTRISKITAVALLGCVVGFVWLWGFDWLYLSDARAYDAQTVDSVIEVSDYSYDSGYGVAADGRLSLDGKTYRVRVYLSGGKSLRPGDIAKGSFRLRFTADGGEKAPTYHQGNGIFLLAYGKEDVAVTPVQEVPAKYFVASLRQGILKLLDAVFPEDAQAFARALLLGDSSKLTYEVDTDFQTSGIRHVIAVSGLHVSILFSLVYLLSCHRRWLTALLGIPTLVLFAAIAGFTPSIIRACVMQGLMILALLLDKEYDPPTALSFAVLVMLAANPLTITSVSFQLSVGCMVGIFLFSSRIHDYLMDEKRFGPAKGKSIKAKLTRWSVGSVSVTVSSMITTTPLCAYYFGSVSLVGILTNLLTLWVISFVFYGIMAACLAGWLWLPLGKVIAWIISWPIRYVLLVADVLGSFSLAAVYTQSVYIVAWLIFCYILLIVYLSSRKKQPILFGTCITAALCVSLLASWLEPKLDDYRVSVLDVGQGQCILLQSHGKTYMVDCGGDTAEGAADKAAQTLLSQGITRLDGLILTHYDADHAGGAALLLSRISADTLYLPSAEDDSGAKASFAAEYSDRIQWIEGDTTLCYQNVKMSLFPSKGEVSDNESSMCVLFQLGNCDILITGDRSAAGERQLLETHQLPKLEVLVVGHHGSKAATSLELLNAAKPAAAAISVSATNNYGHPAQEVLDRLALFGCQVYRTDTDGTIIIRG